MIKRFLRDQLNKRRSAREVFSDVYSKQKWGDELYPFFSGPGSFDEFSLPYVDLLSQHIDSNFSGRARFVDLGCGDFRVGEKLLSALPNIDYHGVDVVPDLISHHQHHHAANKIEFSCRDLAEDELPEGDIAAVRQVLQHLSNAQISRICSKLSQYQAVFITEHLPAKLNKANMDIVHGRRSRRKLNSAVLVYQPPFSLPNVQQVLSVPHRKPGETLTTFLYIPKP